MPYIIICGTSIVAAALTLLSGFGLGTLLLPAFIVFFPAEVAVAATAVVHLLNNIFKFYLVGKHADRGVVLRFSFPAAVCAVLGALLLTKLWRIPYHYNYTFQGHDFNITPVNATIAVLMLIFGLFEMVKPVREERQKTFDRKYIPIGGAVSGFFGGISGHQGALRAAFLIRLGLSKEGFIGTSVVSAIVVDIARISVYGFVFSSELPRLNELGGGAGLPLIGAATVAAFVGSFAGIRLMKKVTFKAVHNIIGIMLISFALLLGIGYI